MPRISRTKGAKRHASAVQLPSKRTFAVQDEQVIESVIPGVISPVDAVTESNESHAGPSTSRLTKSGKLPAAALVPPPLPSHPYSRSHTRREKRKQKQNLAGGEMHHISAALSEAIGEPLHEGKTRPSTAEEKAARKQKQVDAGKIGHGKGRTLTENARRKQIALEAQRVPAVVAHPSFKQNPWATIRLHASNSLATKEGAANNGEGRKRGGDKMEGVE